MDGFWAELNNAEVIERKDLAFNDGKFPVVKLLLRSEREFKGKMYVDDLPISFLGKNANKADGVSVGDIVNVKASLRGTLNRAKTYRFVEVNGWSIEIVGKSENLDKAPSEEEAAAEAPEDENDLPF